MSATVRAKSKASRHRQREREQKGQAGAFDLERTERASRKLPKAGHLAEIVDVFSALGDATRLKLVIALLTAGELCVSDLTLVVEMNISAISTQLRILRGLGIVSRRHEGRLVYYHLHKDAVAVRDLVKRALGHTLRG